MHFLIIAFGMLIPACLHAEVPSLSQLEGEWLNRQFAEKLALTKSPCKAYKVDVSHYTAFIISMADSVAFNWLQIYGFHEGLIPRITSLQLTSEPNCYKVVFDVYQTHGRETENDRFIISDTPAHEIVWSFDPLYGSRSSREIAFIRCEPTIDEYVNRLVIAGTYKDDLGRIFRFGESGNAEWPDKSFIYKVALDLFMTNGKYDCFLVEGEKYLGISTLSYGFEWQHGRLLIFELSSLNEASQYVFNAEPLYVLTPDR